MKDSVIEIIGHWKATSHGNWRKEGRVYLNNVELKRVDIISWRVNDDPPVMRFQFQMSTWNMVCFQEHSEKSEATHLDFNLKNFRYIRFLYGCES